MPLYRAACTADAAATCRLVLGNVALILQAIGIYVIIACTVRLNAVLSERTHRSTACCCFPVHVTAN